MRRVGKYALRLLAGLGALLLILVALALVYRLPLARWALANALADAGATPHEVRVTAVGPHGATIAPLDFSWRGQRISIDSLTVRRHRLFSRSLGRIELKGVAVTLDLAALTAPPAAAPGAAARAATGPAEPGLTFDQLSVDGRIALQTPKAGRELALALTASPAGGGNDIRFAATLSGSGAEARATGRYDLVNSVAEFDLSEANFALADSWAFLRDLAPALTSGWETAGKLTVTARGRAANGAVAGEMAMRLRDGTAGNPAQQISVDGIQADVVFTDPLAAATGPGQTIRVGSARLGNLALHDAVARFQLAGAHECRIESAELGALGGRLSLEPFTCDPLAGTVACVIVADGLRIEDVLALFPDTPARTTGLIDGRLPVTLDRTGLHFGVGWVGLKSGQTATLRFQAPGLLTGKLAPANPAYATLQGIEAGQTPLSVEELRVDLHPAGGPAGRSAQIRIVGRPADPASKLGRVALDLNINGPVESLLNWGLQTRFGAPAAAPGAAPPPAGTKVEPD